MKTVMVTGSNIGLGKEAARQLASIDGVEKVILGCRNKAKAEAAKEDLEKTTGKNIYEVVVIDTSNLASVRTAVASIDAIDGLIMNAGGGLGVDLTSDGVTMSFAVNVLGHVVLTEELLKAGKLSGSVVYSSSEATRGVPQMGMKRYNLTEHSVDEFKKVADGSFLEGLEGRTSDPAMDIYGNVKFMGTLWMASMARKHPDVRFVSVSPGATSGTNGLSQLSLIPRLFFKLAFKIFALFGAAHGIEVGAKRYIDVLIDEENFKSGVFYASKKGVSGELADQVEADPSLPEYKDVKIQDNAVEAIHSFAK